MGELGDKLIGMLDFVYEHEKRFLGTLTEDERTAVGAADDWSFKDVLAHLSYWDIQGAKELVDPATYEPPNYGDDFNATNEEFWRMFTDASWTEVEAMVKQAHKDLIAGVSGLDDEQLSDAERFEWTHNRPLWHRLIFGSFYHPLIHLGHLFVRRGELDEANALQEQAATMQLALSDSEQWRGTVLYNLGCYYAATGQKEEAMKNVAEGLALYDYLREFAPQDGDLAPLHDDPEFMALLQA